MQAVVSEEDDVLVTMGEEMMMHESELHRDIPFEQIGLDEVTLESQFAVQNQIPLISDASGQSENAKLAERYSSHITLNELGKRLLVAAKIGHAEEVKSLMAKGAPFTCDWLGTSALHLAAQFDNIEVAEILLRAGISRDSRTKVEKTALHLAATAGNVIITQMLLNNGTDVNAVDMLHMTPLHWAVDREHQDVIKVLLEHGANPNILSKFSKTAFTIATDKRRPDLIKFIQSVKPAQGLGLLQEMDREMEEATLAATHSLTNEMAQVPAVCQQEEVETSATGKYDTPQLFGTEDYLATKEIVLQEEVCEEPPASTSDQNLSTSMEEDLVPTTNTMEYLQAHGITLLPLEEESSLTEVAMESGSTVVLTEAGKLAMTLTNEEIPTVPSTKPQIIKFPQLMKLKPVKRKQYVSKHISLNSNGIKRPDIVNQLDISDSVEDVCLPAVKKKRSTNFLQRSVDDSNSGVYQFQIRKATLKAEQAERIAMEATKNREEWRQKAELLTEQLSKSQRQNEQYKMLIESLQKKRV